MYFKLLLLFLLFLLFLYIHNYNIIEPYTNDIIKENNRIMEIERKKFQGVLNILSFNRHFYIYGLIVLALIIASHQIFQWSNALLWVVIAAFTYGLLMPLVVSAYVYDFSGYYDFNWLKKLNIEDSNTKQLVNINAGFDETSFLIKNNFPKSNLNVFDFYNADNHTEPAIIRARKVSLVYPNTQQIKSDIIPLKNECVDVIFLLSAAHEIRSQQEKIQFLKECHRQSSLHLCLYSTVNHNYSIFI